MSGALRVGTRGSRLARWQTERVCAALAARGIDTEVVEIHTSGDLSPDVSISTLADPALFTRQLDEAMLERRIDLAVHSLKDLPTELPEGIALVAVSAREDARDALVTRDGSGFAALPEGAVVATSSLRRRAQLLRARPDLRIVEIRGNVPTRVAKLDRSDEMHATVLATAGLVRLGLADRICERLDYELMLPAPGQAAMAVTARTDDPAAQAAARDAINDPDVACCVGAERGLLHALDGGCEVPVAALGTWTDGPERRLVLQARVVSLDGESLVGGRREAAVPDLAAATALGAALANDLLARGARAILDDLRTTSGPGA